MCPPVQGWVGPPVLSGGGGGGGAHLKAGMGVSSRDGCVHLFIQFSFHLYKGEWVHLYSQRGRGHLKAGVGVGCVQQGWVCPPVY